MPPPCSSVRSLWLRLYTLLTLWVIYFLLIFTITKNSIFIKHSCQYQIIFVVTLSAWFGSCHLIHLLCSTSPLRDLLLPLRTFHNALAECMQEEILGTPQYFGSLEDILLFLDLRKGGLGITRAVDLFPFAFLSSPLDSLALQTCLFIFLFFYIETLPPTHAAIESALTYASANMCSMYAKLAIGGVTSTTSFRMSSMLAGHFANGRRKSNSHCSCYLQGY